MSTPEVQASEIGGSPLSADADVVALGQRLAVQGRRHDDFVSRMRPALEDLDDRIKRLEGGRPSWRARIRRAFAALRGDA